MKCRIHANRAKTQLLCARMCAVKTLNSLRCPSNGAMRPRIPGDVPTATQAQLLRPIQSFTYNAVLSNSPTYTHTKTLVPHDPLPTLFSEFGTYSSPPPPFPPPSPHSLLLHLSTPPFTLNIVFHPWWRRCAAAHSELRNPAGPLGRRWFRAVPLPPLPIPLRGGVCLSSFPLPLTWTEGAATDWSAQDGPRWLQESLR